jgi:hypothetical protein
MTNTNILYVMNLFIAQKNIYFQNMPYIVQSFFVKGKKCFPTGISIAHERPVYAQNHIEKENIGCRKMDKSDDTE